jgi:hypothetical protein
MDVFTRHRAFGMADQSRNGAMELFCGVSISSLDIFLSVKD